MSHYIILFSCSDRPGIVHDVTANLASIKANIICADQHSTQDAMGTFFMRLVFTLPPNAFDAMNHQINHLEQLLDTKIKCYKVTTPLRCSIFVSKEDHCLQELLYQAQSNGLNIAVDSIVSNHPIHKKIAEWYDIPFYNTANASSSSVDDYILSKTQSTDIIIMARYMQILSPYFLKSYHGDIINIHHSFLPSFPGAKPYHQAFDRGVKLIGATAHYATMDLDEGPIISQAVESVSHRHRVNDLKLLGAQLEKKCLTTAVRAISEHRVIIHQNKTIVF
ncbi:MAG: formyltetrahydrofolate deformylase [Candidatus Marinamargulisbacteria bacterium]